MENKELYNKKEIERIIKNTFVGGQESRFYNVYLPFDSEGYKNLYVKVYARDKGGINRETAKHKVSEIVKAYRKSTDYTSGAIITTADGMILDGSNRFAAAKAAEVGVEVAVIKNLLSSDYETCRETFVALNSNVSSVSPALLAVLEPLIRDDIRNVVAKLGIHLEYRGGLHEDVIRADYFFNMMSAYKLNMCQVGYRNFASFMRADYSTEEIVHTAGIVAQYYKWFAKAFLHRRGKGLKVKLTSLLANYIMALCGQVDRNTKLGPITVYDMERMAEHIDEISCRQSAKVYIDSVLKGFNWGQETRRMDSFTVSKTPRPESVKKDKSTSKETVKKIKRIKVKKDKLVSKKTEKKNEKSKKRRGRPPKRTVTQFTL